MIDDDDDDDNNTNNNNNISVLNFLYCRKLLTIYIITEIIYL
jgi:hypothetical protein